MISTAFFKTRRSSKAQRLTVALVGHRPSHRLRQDDAGIRTAAQTIAAQGLRARDIPNADPRVLAVLPSERDGALHCEEQP